jgi:UMF1 family MFS transporter
VLGVCLVYVQWAEARGQSATQFVPVTMLITAVAFAFAALPTFLWLRERARPQSLPAGASYVRIGFARVRQTLEHARQFQDLFRFLITLAVYYCGIHTVIVLAAVYAQEVMGFTTRDTILLILVVNITAAVGAFGFGYLQDRLGSVRTLTFTLLVWVTALVLAYVIETRAGFWVVANLVGIALGSSQSAGRALVGQFSPPERSATASSPMYHAVTIAWRCFRRLDSSWPAWCCCCASMSGAAGRRRASGSDSGPLLIMM